MSKKRKSSGAPKRDRFVNDEAAAFEKQLLLWLVDVKELALLSLRDVLQPIAVIDARKRPDIRDIFRLHRQEKTGQGVVTSQWNISIDQVGGGGETTTVYLEALITEPARCRFVIKLDASDEREVLWMDTCHMAGMFHLSIAYQQRLTMLDPEHVATLLESEAITIPITKSWRATLAKRYLSH